MKAERRYDIDWIRVLAFDLLILYHVGMFFVTWEWHIKNNEIIEWMRWPMLFVNQWRMPILFVISGIGTRYALSNKTTKGYIAERFKRLFIPLAFGILVVVSPQVYVERLINGQFEGSFLEFYPNFFAGVYPEGNFSWHHLWFLPYLLLMSIVATPFFLKLRNGETKLMDYLTKKITKSALNLYLFILPLFIIELLLEPFFPVTHALVGDWYALSWYFVFFLTGYILVSLGEIFWDALKRIKWFALIVAVVSFPSILMLWLTYDQHFLIPLVKTINLWSWILVIFAFTAEYLNKKSKLILYRNRAVYPFYILHQTIIIICGYFLFDATIHYALKFLILVCATYALSWLIYEFLILKMPVLQTLMGVKRQSKSQ